MKLHEWLYRLVYEICHDREYFYFCYARHFSELTKYIFEQGRFSESGAYEIPGMKSSKKAILHWQLAHCTDFTRLNTVTIYYTIEDSDTGKKESGASQTFDLSCGESVPTDLDDLKNRQFTSSRAKCQT